MSLAHLNGENVKLLYAIIKQTDVKALDWDLIAQALEGDVTKNAARKRWGRLRQALDSELATCHGRSVSETKTQKTISYGTPAPAAATPAPATAAPATPKKRKLRAEDLEATT